MIQAVIGCFDDMVILELLTSVYPLDNLAFLVPCSGPSQESNFNECVWNQFDGSSREQGYLCLLSWGEHITALTFFIFVVLSVMSPAQ